MRYFPAAFLVDIQGYANADKRTEFRSNLARDLRSLRPVKPHALLVLVFSENRLCFYCKVYLSSNAASKKGVGATATAGRIPATIQVAV